MIPAFLVGTGMGLGVGWWLSHKWYSAELQLVTEQRLRLTDLLAESSALNARCRALLEERIPAASPVQTPALISPLASTAKNVNVRASSAQAKASEVGTT
jgi:hypothetical protein